MINTEYEILEKYKETNSDYLFRHIRKCKICDSSTKFLQSLRFDKICGVSLKPLSEQVFLIDYYQCNVCKFIFTDFFDRFTSDMWEGIIYNKKYYEEVDPEYKIARPLVNSLLLSAFLSSGDKEIKCLDYGGGNGALSEIMNANGYKFNTYDPFGLVTVNQDDCIEFDFCSCFEVVEHSTDPHYVFQDIQKRCSSQRSVIFIGTEIFDSFRYCSLDKWEYAAPRNGHVSFFSAEAFEILAEKFGLKYVSISKYTHLFFRGYSGLEIQQFIFAGRIKNKIKSYFYNNW